MCWLEGTGRRGFEGVGSACIGSGSGPGSGAGCLHLACQGSACLELGCTGLHFACSDPVHESSARVGFVCTGADGLVLACIDPAHLGSAAGLVPGRLVPEQIEPC